jgi:hypothetical protein
LPIAGGAIAHAAAAANGDDEIEGDSLVLLQLVFATVERPPTVPQIEFVQESFQVVSGM